LNDLISQNVREAGLAGNLDLGRLLMQVTRFSDYLPAQKDWRQWQSN